MIHYHGTPITPRSSLLDMAGRHFCVSYAWPGDVETCHRIGQSVMLDNGAFSFWTKGKDVDWNGFLDWARPWLDHQTTWAVAPDVIDETEGENDLLLAWLFNADGDVYRRCAPVWHMHESIDRLKRLCHGYDRVCVGSSGAYRQPGDARWIRRMDEAFNAICGNGPAPTWLHMLRAASQVAGGDWPFASTDSTNVAQNHNRGRGNRSLPGRMAGEIDARQTPGRWRVRHHTENMLVGEL